MGMHGDTAVGRTRPRKFGVLPILDLTLLPVLWFGLFSGFSLPNPFGLLEPLFEPFSFKIKLLELLLAMADEDEARSPIHALANSPITPITTQSTPMSPRKQSISVSCGQL